MMQSVNFSDLTFQNLDFSSLQLYFSSLKFNKILAVSKF